MPVYFGVMSRIGGGASSKRNVSAVSVVRANSFWRECRNSSTTEISVMQIDRTNSDSEILRVREIASNFNFSLSVHLKVMLSVSFQTLNYLKTLQLGVKAFFQLLHL